VNAAINDPRIKAVGTVSMVNIGQMFRNGFTSEIKLANAAPLLVMVPTCERSQRQRNQ